MQRILNYGSSLQAYALKRLIETLDASVGVEFLDYVPGAPLLKPSAAPNTVSRVVAKVTEYGGVDARLRDKIRFLNHKRAYSRKYLPLIGVERELNHDLAVDVQVIGSDEVFNCVQSNTNVGFSRDLFGHDSSAARIVSYAASFGNTTIDRIVQYGVDDILREDLEKLGAISVRDRNSADIVETLTGVRPEIHVDPVLAYDFLGMEKRVPRGRARGGSYVIVYAYPGRITHEENLAIMNWAHGNGARVLCFGGVQECADEFIDCDPFELLAYFRDARAVVTDTFHGTIFSIINSTPFATILRPTVGDGYGNEEKLGYLLDLFGLRSRQARDPLDIDRVLSSALDFHAVQEVLVRERARTLDYLRRAVLS